MYNMTTFVRLTRNLVNIISLLRYLFVISSLWHAVEYLDWLWLWIMQTSVIVRIFQKNGTYFYVYVLQDNI